MKLQVFDVTGRRVRTLIDDRVPAAGSYRVSWDGRTASGLRAASGVYFYRIETDGFRASRRTVLLR